jgi:hypothetical protein
VCYSSIMFEILKQTDGVRGSFVRLIRLGADDLTVLIRSAGNGRIQHRYVGPDSSKAEEVFNLESERILRHIELQREAYR